MTSESHKPEPFGYFRAQPFGWEDCAATDEGARALYDEDALRTQAARIAELEAEVNEQARLNGLGAERELALRAEVERLRKPLTDEQVADIALQSVYDGNACTPYRGAWVRMIGIPFARAIEAAKEG
jgi:hypothetical protein